MPDVPVIDRYKIRRGLGRGAMGSVYLALDPKMGREVAVKVLQKEFAQSSKHRQRFDREARAIAALKHPNIVDIYDYGGSPQEHLYLVMEYIRGPNTGQLCRDKGVFPESVLAALGMQLADALRAAHEGGIIHRDLKPENVFLDGGRLVLADFGIAKAIAEANPFGAEAASPYTDVIGTPGFMAPEQLEQEPLDARCDIFSFGALLYYLASKRLPYDADSPYELLKLFRETRPVPLADIRPELSEHLSRIVQDCIEAERSARPPNMVEVYKRLKDVLSRLGNRESREILRDFEKDPLAFRAEDRALVIGHLVENLKLAVQNQDGIAVDETRARLAVLDPDNSEAAKVTGVDVLLKQRRRAADSITLAGPRPRRPWIPLATIAALAMVLGTLVLTDTVSLPSLTADSPVAEEAAPQVAMLRVRAADRTEVFLDGRALGSTPDFPPAMIPAGEATLEFVHPKKGKLRQTVDLGAGDEVTVVVDWRRKRVRVRKPKNKRAP